MRKTKIICTIGPSSEDPAVFRAMCRQGLNVARLNFSHGTHEEHQKKIDMIKQVRAELRLPIAIMLDTKGPEYRIRTFKNGKIALKDGDTFTFTTREVEGDETIVSVSYAGLADDLNVGDLLGVDGDLDRHIPAEAVRRGLIAARREALGVRDEAEREQHADTEAEG